MTTATELLALAERCEKADGPDRRLDGDIAAALGEHPCWAPKRHERQPELFSDGGAGLRARTWLAPKYTSSYDAAMSLVPTDGSMKLVEFSFTTEPDQPHVWPAASVRWYPPFKSGPNWHGMVVTAPTLILTICAAALRARSASMETPA